MTLSAQLVAARDLSPDQRDAMFVLMDRHFANVQRPRFEADLAEKQWVILVADPATGLPCGFSTQRLLEVVVEGRPVKALFSGDTIIDREHWGSQALTKAWGQLAFTFIDADPGAELYWFLISKGYRTYRFLPVFFQDFYPRHDTPTPAWASAIITALARSRYPEEYDADLGVIRATTDQYCLRPGLADVTPERLADRDVRFFQERNPGHPQGDELCCLAPLTRANFTRAAYRVIPTDSQEGKSKNIHEEPEEHED